MTGEVRLNEEEQSIDNDVRFEDLEEEEGVLIKERPCNLNGLRLKISSTHYLHFILKGTIHLNNKFYWPENIKEPIRRFKLVAEEI